MGTKLAVADLWTLPRDQHSEVSPKSWAGKADRGDGEGELRLNTLAYGLSVFRTPVCQPWLRSLYPGFGCGQRGFRDGFGAGDPTVSMAGLTLELRVARRRG